jgi:uncharacterized membrane protein SpoIIM required for sporulation
MVLESIISPLKAEKRPWEVFFMGMLYSSVAIVLSLWIFLKEASMVMVLLTVAMSTPLIYRTIRYEERKDVELKTGEKKLLEEHSKAIEAFVMLFFGFFASFVIWYVFLPTGTTEMLFSAQSDTIQSINGPSGNAVNVLDPLVKIFLNNARVLALCILFSLVFGAGAIFILAWNASVGGAFIGNFIRTKLELIGSPTIINYFSISSLGLVRYLPHGVFEMGAYFIGGLAGGIISSAIIRKDYKNGSFEKILFDTSDLILIAGVVLMLGAFVEVFITPGLVSFWEGIFVR